MYWRYNNCKMSHYYVKREIGFVGKFNRIQSNTLCLDRDGTTFTAVTILVLVVEIYLLTCGHLIFSMYFLNKRSENKKLRYFLAWNCTYDSTFLILTSSALKERKILISHLWFCVNAFVTFQTTLVHSLQPSTHINEHSLAPSLYSNRI